MMVSGIGKVLGLVDRELWVVTAQAGERRGGLIATFVSEASIPVELPRVVLGLGMAHHTWDLIEASGAFGLHLLGEEQLDWVWRFGLESGRGWDKLAGLSLKRGVTGTPLLEGALGWLECRVEARMFTGERTLYLAEVVDGSLLRDAAPLTEKRLFELAPEDKLEEMSQLYQEDSARDARAILDWRAWRARKSGTARPPEGGTLG